MFTSLREASLWPVALARGPSPPEPPRIRYRSAIQLLPGMGCRLAGARRARLIAGVCGLGAGSGLGPARDRMEA